MAMWMEPQTNILETVAMEIAMVHIGTHDSQSRGLKQWPLAIPSYFISSGYPRTVIGQTKEQPNDQWLKHVETTNIIDPSDNHRQPERRRATCGSRPLEDQPKQNHIRYVVGNITGGYGPNVSF